VEGRQVRIREVVTVGIQKLKFLIRTSSVVGAISCRLDGVKGPANALLAP
jgi:hypothetical protein